MYKNIRKKDNNTTDTVRGGAGSFKKIDNIMQKIMCLRR